MEFTLLDPKNHKPVAKVRLRGYRIAAGGPLGLSGALRSFTLLAGDVDQYWAQRQPLILRREDGRQTTVRIAALPVEDGETGLVEFL
jgi:hypothetical protein